jgi:uroporphyrinogen decarboxylase
LFDTWAGELNRDDYEEFALPATRKIFDAIGRSVPRILYINGCSTILESMANSGAEVISLDWRISLAEAVVRVGERVALQGNLDPVLLLGSKERLLAKTAEILEQGGMSGHILNLGHGILPSTPVENARAFIEFAKGYRPER